MNNPAARPLDPPEPSRWLRWTLACTVGLAPVALLMPLFISADALPPVQRILALAVFGAVEGLLLGWAQSYALVYEHMIWRRLPWIVATAAASCIAYVVCAIGMSRMPASMTEQLSPWVMVFWGGHGALVGLVQWAVLRHRIPDACPLVAAFGLAWMVGQNLVYPNYAAAVAGEGMGPLMISRLVMGLLVGAVSGMSLVLMTESFDTVEEGER